MQGAQRRLENQHDDRVSHAWLTAAMIRSTEGLPELDTLLSNRKPKEQSIEVQEIAMDHMFLAWGGDPEQLKKLRREGAPE